MPAVVKVVRLTPLFVSQTFLTGQKSITLAAPQVSYVPLPLAWSNI
jgi:hypothetical protein